MLDDRLKPELRNVTDMADVGPFYNLQLTDVQTPELLLLYCIHIFICSVLFLDATFLLQGLPKLYCPSFAIYLEQIKVDSIAVSLFTNSETAAATPLRVMRDFQRSLNQ